MKPNKPNELLMCSRQACSNQLASSAKGCSVLRLQIYNYLEVIFDINLVYLESNLNQYHPKVHIKIGLKYLITNSNRLNP